jgi:outer membrane protein assembly factor BamB
MRYLVSLIIIGAACIRFGEAAELTPNDWPQFRGPNGNGHATAKNLPVTWGGVLESYAWKQSIPGRGWSSPVVIDGRIWLTTAESVAIPESEQAGEERVHREGGFSDFKAHRSVTFFAIELDANSGAILRKLELFTVDRPPSIHATNSYASPTPTTDGARLYCHFGSLGTVGIDMDTGRILWKQTLSVDDITGSGSSPILFGDRLIISCDGADEQFVAALDKQTGALLWRTARPPIEVKESFMRRAFSTPLLIDYLGRQQVIVPTAGWLVSYDPFSGAEWWRCRTAKGYSVIPQPAFYDGLVFTCSGYLKPELWAIRADGSGDVSETHVAWKHTRQVPEIASPIVVDDGLYFVSAAGVLSCLRAIDGQARWQHRLEGSYASSPIFADNKLYITNQSGLTTVVKPAPIYAELAKNQTFGETMASIAIAGESLLLRTDPVLYCIRNIR